MNSETYVPEYKKVYLFVTYRINQNPNDRFYNTPKKDWNFNVNEIESYFSEHKNELFVNFYNSLKIVSLSEVIENFFDASNQKKATLESLKKKIPLDLSKEKENVDRLLNGIDYTVLKKPFRDFIDIEYSKYTKENITFKNWQEIFYIEDKNKKITICALNDYDKEKYRQNFIQYIFVRLPKLFPAQEYFVFIHGRYLIEGNPKYEHPEKIYNIECPKKFHIKTFHHTIYHNEYKFLIDQDDFNYLKLEILFNENIRESLKAIRKSIYFILNDPENSSCKEEKEKIINSIEKIKENTQLNDSIFTCSESLRNTSKGKDIVNMINNLLKESDILKLNIEDDEQ